MVKHLHQHRNDDAQTLYGALQGQGFFLESDGAARINEQ